VRIRPGEEKDTTTVIIRYRIPMPPREWKESADVEELLLRKHQRSLEYPVQAGSIQGGAGIAVVNVLVGYRVAMFLGIGSECFQLAKNGMFLLL
jgi:hypothetical protein